MLPISSNMKQTYHSGNTSNTAQCTTMLNCFTVSNNWLVNESLVISETWQTGNTVCYRSTQPSLPPG